MIELNAREAEYDPHTFSVESAYQTLTTGKALRDWQKGLRRIGIVSHVYTPLERLYLVAYRSSCSVGLRVSIKYGISRTSSQRESYGTGCHKKGYDLKSRTITSKRIKDPPYKNGAQYGSWQVNEL